MLSFFPRDVLDEICDSTESVSEGFTAYSSISLQTDTDGLQIRSNVCGLKRTKQNGFLGY